MADITQVTAILQFQLPVDEGNRLQVYDDKDSKTLFIGKTLLGNPTIGTGRNLIGKGISDIERRYLLTNDINDTYDALDKYIPWWRQLDTVRASVLANMCFNMGIAKLLTFKKFLYSLKVADWENAVIEMKDSAWWNQVGNRAVRLSAEISTGQSPIQLNNK